MGIDTIRVAMHANLTTANKSYNPYDFHEIKPIFDNSYSGHISATAI